MGMSADGDGRADCVGNRVEHDHHSGTGGGFESSDICTGSVGGDRHPLAKLPTAMVDVMVLVAVLITETVPSFSIET